MLDMDLKSLLKVLLEGSSITNEKNIQNISHDKVINLEMVSAILL